MDDIDLKKEDIMIVSSIDGLEMNQIIIQAFGQDKEAQQLKQQILRDREIVKRLKEQIKIIESLEDKDTLYSGHIELIERVLPILQQILEGDKK